MNRNRPLAARLSVFLTLLGTCALAQAQPPSRIAGAVDAGKRHVLARSTHPLAAPASDRGRIDGALPLQRMILVLSRSAEQNAELDQLIAAASGLVDSR